MEYLATLILGLLIGAFTSHMAIKEAIVESAHKAPVSVSYGDSRVQCKESATKEWKEKAL